MFPSVYVGVGGSDMIYSFQISLLSDQSFTSKMFSPAYPLFTSRALFSESPAYIRHTPTSDSSDRTFWMGIRCPKGPASLSGLSVLLCGLRYSPSVLPSAWLGSCCGNS